MVLLGLLVLAIGFAIEINDTFHDPIDLKREVETRIDYVQYWVGFPVRNVYSICNAEIPRGGNV